MRLSSLWFALTLLAGSNVARAQSFGQQGQIVPQGRVGLYVFQNADSSAYTLSIVPGVRYFVLENLAVGGSITASYSRNTQLAGVAGVQTDTVAGVGPSVAYNIAFTDTLGLFPSLELLYTHEWNYNSRYLSYLPGGFDTFSFAVSVPLLWHVVPHVYLGLGPYVQAPIVQHTLDVEPPLGTQDWYVNWGIATVIGAWF